MPRHEALKALEIYRRAGQQVTPESRRGWSLKYSKILKRSKHCVFSLLLFRLFDTFQAGSLSDFYENCRGLELARNFQFPTLREVRTCTVCLVLTICTGLCCDILWGEILSHHKHFLQLWRIMWRRLHAWSQFENPWLVIGRYHLYKISVYVYSIVGFDILQFILPQLACD